YRGFLQKLGTEVGRNLHPRAWEYALFADYKSQREKIEVDGAEEYQDVYPNWIITDVRFENEAEAIRSRGGLNIRVFRPGHIRVWWNDPETDENYSGAGWYWLQGI